MTQDDLISDSLEWFIREFWKKVIKHKHKCWEWKGRIDYQGYAVLDRIKVARLSWFIHHGKYAGHKCVLHRCDNPECTRPKCLFLGTKGDNNTDRAQKGRNKFKWKTLSIDTVKSIRRKYKRGWKNAKLSRYYGVTTSTIHQVVTRKSYKYI